MQKVRIMIAGTRRTSFQVLVRILERASDDFDVIEQAWGDAEAMRLLQKSQMDTAESKNTQPDRFGIPLNLPDWVRFSAYAISKIE